MLARPAGTKVLQLAKRTSSPAIPLPGWLAQPEARHPVSTTHQKLAAFSIRSRFVIQRAAKLVIGSLHQLGCDSAGLIGLLNRSLVACGVVRVNPGLRMTRRSRHRSTRGYGHSPRLRSLETYMLTIPVRSRSKVAPICLLVKKWAAPNCSNLP